MSLFSASSSGWRSGLLPQGRATDIAVLDVGSSKLCCLIGRLTPRDGSSVLPGRSHTVEILGIGYQRSQGFKSGTVVDMDLAEQSIRRAVSRAEESSRMNVDSLIVTVSAGRLASNRFNADVSIGGREVSRRDLNDVLNAGCASAMVEGRKVLHALPIGYRLDDADNVTDPLSMVGETLGVDMNIVDADAAPLRNLEACINRAHLSVDAMVAAPYASGLAALVDDEARMGAACVDLGAGTTTLSVFLNGEFIACDGIAVGGNHVTMDIARCLSIRVQDAERLKVLHGTAVASQIDERELLSVASLEDEAGQPLQISVAQLSQIIRPRVEEIFEMLRDRINATGLASSYGRRMVLTGGASQLRGVSEVATQVMGVKTRLGRPMGVSGLPQKAKSPAFSAATGLLIYPQVASREFVASNNHARMSVGQSNKSFGRISRWLRESF